MVVGRHACRKTEEEREKEGRRGKSLLAAGKDYIIKEMELLSY